jgi:hypothetical protein
MVANTTEIALRTEQTRAFIDAEPIDLALTRRPWIPDGAGGFKRGPATLLPALTLRLVSPNTQLPMRRTVDGRDAQPIYTLLGMPTDDIQNGDTFTVDAVRYEVVFVQPKKLDALRAEVAYGR